MYNVLMKENILSVKFEHHVLKITTTSYGLKRVNKKQYYME